jgi:hypothetical protein
MDADELRGVGLSLFKRLTFKQAMIDKPSPDNAFLKRPKLAGHFSKITSFTVGAKSALSG